MLRANIFALMCIPKVFISSHLSSAQGEALWKTLGDVLAPLQLNLFLPGKALPVSNSLPAEIILNKNLNEILASDIFICALDHAGEGVFIELGFALAHDKYIFILSERPVTSYGKFIQAIASKHSFANSVNQLVKQVQRYINSNVRRVAVV